MLKVNDIVKFKFNGTKRKFRVVGENETIKEGVLVSCYIAPHGTPYEDTLHIAEAEGLSKLSWMRTNCAGEKITPSHTHRVYLELISF